MPTSRPRASLYTRLSRRADETNTSLDAMIRELRELCQREGFEEVALHVDDGISGAVRDRPEFVAWLDDAREGRADVLVAHHVDRMTREGLSVAAMILDVHEGKDPRTGRVVRPPVRLMDTKGLDSNNGAAFRIMFLLRAEIAREERERIKQRHAGRKERLRRAGRWAGGIVPYGYRVVDRPEGGKTLAIEPAEADAIRYAAELIVAGAPLGRVVRRLNDEGIRPRNTLGWSPTVLRQILTGEHILGRVTVGGVVQRDQDGHALTPFPAVLDLATAMEVRRRLKPGTRPPTGRHPTRLASRVVECASCGGLLTVIRRTTHARSENDRVAYRCQHRATLGVCPRPVVIQAVPLERYLEESYIADFGRLPLVEYRVEVAGGEDLARVEDALAATLASLGQNATPEAFERLRKLQAERDRLAALPREPVVTPVPTGRTLAEEWTARDVDGRRQLLSEAYAAIRVHPGHRPLAERVELIPAEGVHDPD